MPYDHGLNYEINYFGLKLHRNVVSQAHIRWNVLEVKFIFLALVHQKDDRSPNSFLWIKLTKFRRFTKKKKKKLQKLLVTKKPSMQAGQIVFLCVCQEVYATFLMACNYGVWRTAMLAGPAYGCTRIWEFTIALTNNDFYAPW